VRPDREHLARAVRDAAARLRNRIFIDPFSAFDFGLDLSGSFDADCEKGQRAAGHRLNGSVRDAA